MQLRTFLIAGCVFFTQQIFGQLPAIDTIKIIPANPVAGDEVKAIYHTVFPSGGCQLENYSITQNGNLIILDLEYNPGMLTYICHDSDTISLGNLDAGYYQLITNLIAEPMGPAVDIEINYFTVGEALSVDKNAFSDLSVYPNPFEKEIVIRTSKRIEKAAVYAISGQKVLDLNLSGFVSNQSIPLPGLKSGSYLLVLTDDNGNRYTRQITRN